MSVLASTWAWQQELPPHLKLTLVALADHAHDDGTAAFPSKERLAKKTGYSERQIQRNLRALIIQGSIYIIEHATRYRPTEYGLNMKRTFEIEVDQGSHTVTPGIQPIEGRGDTHDAPGETPMAPRGDTHDSLTIKEPSVEPSNTSSPPAATDGDIHFDAFWELYPRKVGKAAARKAFLKACQRTDVAEVVGGAGRLACDPNLPPPEFIPHPSTWLNRDGWLDEAYPVRERSRQEAESEVYGGFMDRMRERNASNN